MKIGSLFSGAGGLDMAVQSVFGADIVWHSEIDKAASKVLAHRFPGVPNLGDITKVNWNSVETVDVICGGFPCQDVSTAGRRAGLKSDTRSGLWYEMARIIGLHSPTYVVIENVRGLLSATANREVELGNPTMGDRTDRPILRAIGAVLGDLCELGYDTQWATVRASDIGAPHRRERVFIIASLADSASKGREGDFSETEPGLPRRDCDDAELLTTPKARDWKGTNSNHGGPWQSLPRDVTDLLPTPCAQQSGNTPKNHLANKPGRKVVTDLAILVENGLIETGGELLPNPTAQPFTSRSGDRISELGLLGVVKTLLPTPVVTDASSAGRHTTDTGVMNPGTSLTDAIRLLPTPSTHDQTGPRNPDSISRMDKPFSNLNDTCVNELLPTPNASDGSGGGQQLDKREGHSRQLIDYVLASESQWGKYTAAIDRWQQIVGPAPAPTEPNRNGKPRLNPAFSEWMMGWPAGWVTDPDIGITRRDQLRIIGNGVCPQQAHSAIRWLLSVCEVAG